MELDEPREQADRLGHHRLARSGLEGLALVRLVVAVRAVGVDAVADGDGVELGVELRGVDVAAEPEGVDRARLRGGEQDRPLGQPGHRFLVAEVGRELRRQHAEQRVGLPVGAQPHRQGTNGLAVGAVDDPTVQATEDADAVAGAEEGEVRADDTLREPAQVCLGPALGRGLHVLGVGGVEGAAAQDDARPVGEVDLAERPLLQADPHQLVGAQAAAGQHGVVLLLRDVVLGAGAEEEEGAHRLSLDCGAGVEERVHVGDPPRGQRLAGVLPRQRGRAAECRGGA